MDLNFNKFSYVSNEVKALIVEYLFNCEREFMTPSHLSDLLYDEVGLDETDTDVLEQSKIGAYVSGSLSSLSEFIDDDSRVVFRRKSIFDLPKSLRNLGDYAGDVLCKSEKWFDREREVLQSLMFGQTNNDSVRGSSGLVGYIIYNLHRNTEMSFEDLERACEKNSYFMMEVLRRLDKKGFLSLERTERLSYKIVRGGKRIFAKMNSKEGMKKMYDILVGSKCFLSSSEILNAIDNSMTREGVNYNLRRLYEFGVVEKISSRKNSKIKSTEKGNDFYEDFFTNNGLGYSIPTCEMRRRAVMRYSDFKEGIL